MTNWGDETRRCRLHCYEGILSRTALWNLRMHSLQGHSRTMQDRTFSILILPPSVFHLMRNIKYISVHILQVQYINSVYCCYYLKRMRCRRVNGKMWQSSRVKLGKIYFTLFYVRLHWMLVCCGHEPDIRLAFWKIRWPQCHPTKADLAWRGPNGSGWISKFWRGYLRHLNCMAEVSQRVLLCDTMRRFVCTVGRDSS